MFLRETALRPYNVQTAMICWHKVVKVAMRSQKLLNVFQRLGVCRRLQRRTEEEQHPQSRNDPWCLYPLHAIHSGLLRTAAQRSLRARVFPGSLSTRQSTEC
jgi:hypothetical protein